MLLPEKLQFLVRFIAQIEAKMDFRPQRGRPYAYSQLGMLLFFHCEAQTDTPI